MGSSYVTKRCGNELIIGGKKIAKCESPKNHTTKKCGSYEVDGYRIEWAQLKEEQ